MRRILVAGNWKMNGSRASAAALIEGIRAGLGSVQAADVAVCPPFVYLPDVARALAGSPIALGAQDVAREKEGAYTGEISGAMLRDVGCTHVVIGHSERRAYYGETDERVAEKMQAALDAGLIPIVCVGETLDEREAGTTEAVVARQLDAVLAKVGAQGLARGVVAYEPVWAIGTGRTATPDQAQAVHRFLRERVAKHDAGVAQGLRILYGGSVNGANARELFAQPDIDGGLVGGASLKADEFLRICTASD